MKRSSRRSQLPLHRNRRWKPALFGAAHTAVPCLARVATKGYSHNLWVGN